MADTPVSLLERIRLRPTDASWKQLTDLYTPLIHGWLRRHAVQNADADDLVQEVLGVVVRKLPQFFHSGKTGSFRSWLRQITRYCLDDLRSARQSRPIATADSDMVQMLHELEDPHSDLSRQWDREHDRHVTHFFLKKLQPDFEPMTWKAFVGVVMDGKDTAAVAVELGTTPNAVRIAKSRVLRRLRQESKGLLD